MPTEKKLIKLLNTVRMPVDIQIQEITETLFGLAASASIHDPPSLSKASAETLGLFLIQQRDKSFSEINIADGFTPLRAAGHQGKG